MMSWLKILLDQTSIYEAPREYYYWSGLTAISAAVKDHVWINRSSEKFRTYPNIYVLLLAKTGVTRKSHPVSLIEQIVSESKVTRVISGRSSIEKIVDDLGTATTIDDPTTKTRRIIKDSCGLVISGELSASLVTNSQALTILTNLFDRSYNVGSWKINLKSGVKILEKPTLSFLAATNDELMKSFFEVKDMYGGFLGRTFVVSADVPKLLNPLLRHNDSQPDVKALAGYLSELTKISGPFNISEEVMVHYEEWYKDYYGPVKEGEVEINDRTGTFPRIGDHVLKVAMLLSLSEGCSLDIKMDHMIEAITLCKPFVEISARAVRGIGKSTFAAQTAMVMEYLERKDGFSTRISILQHFTGDINHEDLNNITTHLEESGFIEIERYGSGNAYRIPGKVLEKYRKFKEGRKNVGN